MLNIEVHKYDNFETTAIGAALISLVGIGEYDNLEEAIKLHNDVPQGLSSSIFTNNVQNAELYK